MREIKFRAWFELKNKMVKSENLKLNYDGSDYGFDFAFDDEDLDENANINGTMNFKLMQYTGLKDKNGVEIYEGDLYETKEIIEKVVGDIILDKIESKIIKPIVFEKGSFYYDGHLLYDVIKYDENFKRVGNIYENKELLEDK